MLLLKLSMFANRKINCDRLDVCDPTNDFKVHHRSLRRHIQRNLYAARAEWRQEGSTSVASSS